MELSHLANIRTGVVLSRKEATPLEYTAEYKALNLKAVSEQGVVDKEILEPYYASERLKMEYFTRERDVLLRLSAPYTAVWINENDIDLLVPAHFAIIRAKPRLLDSHYLYWWLTKNKRIFYRMASGATMMGTISSGYIADMAINVPPIDLQREIGKIIRLSEREQQLLERLGTKKRQLSDALIAQIENGGLTL
ncbi:MAG: hypothetical protein LBN26_01650 [Christensenellaceae bacterium]|jgi:restriction endonuclease S subunit|nr:hypothetical protein [Christensenellaceae bacterium]